MKFNDVMVWLLKSPFHGILSGSIMLVEVKGRKTGHPVRLPVNFHQESGQLWVISSRNRVWWRNLLTEPRAVLWLRGRQLSARGEVLQDESSVAGRFSKLFTGDTRLASALKVRLDKNASPLAEDLQRIVKERLFVKFLPEE